VLKNLARRETDETNEKCAVVTVAHLTEHKPLVLLQVNCRSIYNKILDFWNLTHNPDVVTSTESWPSEEISNAEDLRDLGLIIHRAISLVTQKFRKRAVANCLE
jgi:hypothetical protein